MLNPRAGAPAANPDGRSAPEVSLDGQTPWHRTGTSDNWGRLRQKTGLLVLFGVRRQGYSTYEMRADGLLTWVMSVHKASSMTPMPAPISGSTTDLAVAPALVRESRF